MSKEKSSQKLRVCPRWDYCSINICPADLETDLRNKLPGENPCPFTIKKRLKEQKGIKLLAPDSLLKVIPKPNLKILNRGNQKRWHSLHQKK